MRVTNEPGGDSPFHELSRLQSEFQKRLTEETMRFLRQLQGAVGPMAPGTVVDPTEGTAELAASGHVGQRVTLRLEVENRQQVYCVVTPMLSPLVAAHGVTWFPAAEPSPSSMLLAPEEVQEILVELSLPDELQPGAYRGALILYGLLKGGVPVEVTVVPKDAPKKATAPEKTAEKAAAPEKTAASKTAVAAKKVTTPKKVGRARKATTPRSS